MPFRSERQRRWMYANHPRMARRWEDETPDGPLPDEVSEAGHGSGRYTAAFTHPDPMDPNDRVRQKSHSRSKEFPYDRPTRYGEPESQAMDGSKYHDGGYGGQLTPWFFPDDDGDIDLDEASGTPYMFGRSSMDYRRDSMPTSQARSLSGPHMDDLDIPGIEFFGEDPPDLEEQIDELMADEETWPAAVRLRGLLAMEDMTLGECFAVYNTEGPEVVSLLETLTWDE